MESRGKRFNETWLTEESTKHLRLSLRTTGELVRKESPYQSILAVDTAEYGRTLVLDGAIQLTERDEFCYHEMMAHVALCSHPNPKKVLIVGGGDGGSLREVVKHDCVEKAVLVDIDEEVINTSRKFFPTLSCGMKDPKAEIRPMDAMVYMKEHQGEFDVVIVDSTDPVDMAAGLYEEPFYRDVYNALNDGGYIVAQTESPFSDAEVMLGAYKGISSVFKSAYIVLGYMPTYPTGMWTYTIGSKKYDPRVPLRSAPEGLKYYSEDIHRAAFVLPPFVKEMLEKGEAHSNY